MKLSLAIATGLALLAGCRSASTNTAPEPRDAALREALLSAVRGLEGRWEMAGPDGPSVIEFRVTANGSAVREVMFPGTPMEMTNMYTLDGNSLVMTHYCAAGNQPRMRAHALEDGELAFVTDGVSDLESPDALYMADMTLVLVDEDHIEQHWRAVRAGEVDHMPVFELERLR
jgi:hypothetical protein